MADRMIRDLVSTCGKVGLVGLFHRRLIDAVGELQAFAAVRANRDLTLLEQLKEAGPKTPTREVLFDHLAQDYIVTLGQLYTQANRQLLREQGRFEQAMMISDLELDAADYTVVSGQLGSGRER